MISDEITRKACLATVNGCACEECQKSMRAALFAVLPLIVEKCAKRLDKRGINGCEIGGIDPSTGTFECRRLARGECNCCEFDEEAEAIRSLARP
jgi:hypothetical protein